MVAPPRSFTVVATGRHPKPLATAGHYQRSDFLFAAPRALVHVQSEQYCSDKAERMLLWWGMRDTR
jgi:hypothetical protein